MLESDLNRPQIAFEKLFEAISAPAESRAGDAQAGGAGAGAGDEAAAVEGDVHTIFVCEAVMIYLADGAPHDVLALSADFAVSRMCVPSLP